ncbi:hypothetical protein [Streptomyces bluensis]
MTTKIPSGVTGGAKGSLIPTVKEAAAALNDVKPVHGNLWM